MPFSSKKKKTTSVKSEVAILLKMKNILIFFLLR